jgi:hypothetical protein
MFPMMYLSTVLKLFLSACVAVSLTPAIAGGETEQSDGFDIL